MYHPTGLFHSRPSFPAALRTFLAGETTENDVCEWTLAGLLGVERDELAAGFWQVATFAAGAFGVWLAFAQ